MSQAAVTTTFQPSCSHGSTGTYRVSALDSPGTEPHRTPERLPAVALWPPVALPHCSSSGGRCSQRPWRLQGKRRECSGVRCATTENSGYVVISRLSLVTRLWCEWLYHADDFPMRAERAPAWRLFSCMPRKLVK